MYNLKKKYPRLGDWKTLFVA